MERTIRSAALLLAVFSLGPHDAWSAEQWKKVESTHFEVIGDVGYGRLISTIESLEQFRLASTRLFPARRLDSSRRLTVVVFEGSSIRPYLPRYRGRVRDEVAGYFFRAVDRSFLVMREDALRSMDLRLVLHEYQHVVTSENIQRAPTWLNEGLSEFYSTFVANPNGRSYEIGHAIVEHVRTLKSDGIIPLEEFFAVDPSSRTYNDSMRVGTFYAQSWAFIHFCMFGDEGRWGKPFARMVGAIAGGQSSLDAFRREFGADAELFTRRFRAYVFRFTMPAMRVTFDESAKPAKGYEQSMLDADETEYLKARLAVDPDFGQKRLDALLTANPAYRPARVLRGQMWVSRGMWDEAATLLHETARADGSDVATCGIAMHALNLVRRHEDVLGICPDVLSGGQPEIALERSVALDALNRKAEAKGHYGLATSANEEVPVSVLDRVWRYLEADLPVAAAGAAGIVVRQTALDPEVGIYVRFARFLAFALGGQIEYGRKELAAATVDGRASPWAKAIYTYLTGESTDEALLKLANGKDQQTEAHAYVGLVLASTGHTGEAKPHLQWVVQNGNRDFYEYKVVAGLGKRQRVPTS